MAHILAVDDDHDLCALLKTALERDGHTVETRTSGTQLTDTLCRWADCILLDVMMPGEDGFAVCRRIRAETDAPILFLTARTDEPSVLTGLGLGADDYLTKPFALEELEARVRTLLRREFRQRESLVQVGALTLNTVTREVSGRGAPLPLPPREFGILAHLMLHRGCWISQEELMEHIWEADANPFSNAVRMHISSLRKKLRKRLGHDPIQTKVGRGYRLAGEETA